MLVQTPKLTAKLLAGLESVWLLQREIEPLVAETNRWTGTLRRQALGNAVRASNSIEGFKASSSKVQDVLLGIESSELEQATQDALVGYRDAMNFVLAISQDGGFEFDFNLVKSLHFMLTKNNPVDRPGRFRVAPVYVRESGSGLVVHEGADFEQLNNLVAELCSELSSRKTEVNIVQAAMAHLNLVLIHPFKDGNGRMARILQSAVLATESKISPVFISIEEYLAEHTAEYYKVLAEVGGGSWNPKVDATNWIEFNLEAHWQQAHRVKQNTKFLNALWNEIAQLVEVEKLNERVIPALTHSALGNRLTNLSYREVLRQADESVSGQSAGRDLVLLSELKLLKPIGETKSRSYLAGLRLAELADSIRNKTLAKKPQRLFED